MNINEFIDEFDRYKDIKLSVEQYKKFQGGCKDE